MVLLDAANRCRSVINCSLMRPLSNNDGGSSPLSIVNSFSQNAKVYRLSIVSFIEKKFFYKKKLALTNCYMYWGERGDLNPQNLDSQSSAYTYSATLTMVPRRRLELLRLSSLASKASMFSNFIIEAFGTCGRT